MFEVSFRVSTKQKYIVDMHKRKRRESKYATMKYATMNELKNKNQPYVS